MTQIELREGRMWYGKQLLVPEVLQQIRAEQGWFAESVARYILKRISAPKPVYSIDIHRNVPEGRRLLPHQIGCMEQILYEMDGHAMLAPPPGMGKTPIGCVAMSIYGGPVLILCPSNKLKDWHRHGTEWINPSMFPGGIKMFKSAKDVFSTPIPTTERPEIWIMSHGLCVRVAEHLQRAKWTSVLVDESHKMKNGLSKCTNVLFSCVGPHTRCCLMISATPMLNRPEELFSSFKVLVPSVFSYYREFTARYCNGHEDPRTGHWDARGASNCKELNALLSLVMIEGKNLEEVKLTEKTRTIVPCKTTPEFQRSYFKWCKELKELEDRMEKTRGDELDKLTRARQGVLTRILLATGLEKVPSVVSLVQDLYTNRRRGRIVVFCHHEKVGEAIKAGLEQRGIQSLFIPGSIPGEKRETMLEPIRRNEGPIWVAILTIGASSAGIEASPGASDMVLAELDYVPANLKQVEGRLHRLNSTHAIACYWLIAKPSYDERVQNILERKENVRERVFAPGQSKEVDHIVVDEDVQSTTSSIESGRKRARLTLE